MNTKRIPFTLDQIRALTREHSTPFYVYDEAGIRNSARTLFELFSWNAGFREYFPVKATPNPAILKILKEEGCAADCCSVPELLIAEEIGLTGESVMLTSNFTGPEEFKKAREMKAIINLDDPNHLPYLDDLAGMPEVLCLRYNPGPFSQNGSETWSHLTEDKFGMKKDQLLETYVHARENGIRRFGLHMMIMSNDLDGEHFVETARICFDTAVELRRISGINLDFIDLGGGVGIPYRPDQEAIDMATIVERIRTMYEDHLSNRDLEPLRLFTEFGRFVVGQHGYLVATVRHIKESYKHFAGLDATMADLMRPGMYGSYHHISILNKLGEKSEVMYDVVGSLCENNDRFAIDRQLPLLDPGDVVVIHDAGAYGRGKGFNFNGKLRPAEFLLEEDGVSFKKIRRAETSEDYLSTLRV